MAKLNPKDLEAISGRTLGHYDRQAEDFWRGTRDHDVSQNIGALLQHIVGEPPFKERGGWAARRGLNPRFPLST